MLPDNWLVNPRVRKLRQKFLTVPRTRFLDLAEHMFGTVDLDRQQLGALVQLLTDSEHWPSIERAQTGSTSMEQSELAEALLDAPKDDWLPEVLPLLLELQPGSSMLDLGCHQGHGAQVLTGVSFYEGHDLDPKRVQVAKQLFPEQQFHVTDVSRWLAYEPRSSYSLVLVHLPADHYTVHGPCLETQRGPDIVLDAAMLEWGAKCCTRGGILVGLINRQDNLEAISQWLRNNGTPLMFSAVDDKTLVVYRHGIRMREYPTVTDSFANYGELTDFLMAKGYLARTPVCADDPRPLEISDWGIELLTQEVTGFSETGATLLYKSKHAAGIRWQDERAALGWAMHQAFKATREESWNKTSERFSQRLGINDYLQYRSGNLHDLLNLTAEFAVEETPELKGHANKLTKRYSRLRTPYPERATIDNRYYSLGPGDKLQRNDELWSVQFSEPDFSGKNPPKLHLNKVE